MKVAITTSSFAKYSDQPLAMLREKGIAYVLNETGRVLTEAEAGDLISGCVGLVAGTEPLTERVMAGNASLKVISRCGVGMDNVDLIAASRLGVLVFNTPDAPTLAAAEYTVALLFDLLRHTSAMSTDLRNGIWKKRMGNLLCGKRVGIVGMGRIGGRVASYLQPFQVEMGYCDIEEREAPYQRMSMAELLAWADIITLHCPGLPEKKPLLGAAELAAMRPGAWLINAARGGLVDEAALCEALRSGRLSGAALDVFCEEPYSGPLLELPQALLSPHAASYAREARVDMDTAAVRHLLEGLGG